jgi:tetratricopeptide (TPR) repeat protein
MGKWAVWGASCLLLLGYFAPVWAEEHRGRVYYDFGVFAFEDGDYQAAEANFLKALSFDPQNPFYNHFLGKTYVKIGDYDKAEQYLNAAWGLDWTISGLKYDLALLFFQRADYEKATPLFEELAAEDPTNVLSRYYAGIGNMNLKQYDKALENLIKASELSPTVKPNGYYYAGVCHLQLGQYEEATEKLQFARDNAETVNLRQNAEKWLKTSQARQKSERIFRLSLKYGYQYDSNVLLEPLDEDLPTDESDSAFVFNGSFTLDLFRSGGFSTGFGFNHYQIEYQDLSQYNLYGSTANIFVKFKSDKITLNLSYLPAYYALDEEGYLVKHQFRPDLFWRASEDLTVRFGLKYETKDYLENELRSGHAHLLDTDLYYSLLNRKVQLFCGGGFESSSAKSLEQSYEEIKARAGARCYLPWQFQFGINGKLSRKNYGDVNPFFGVKREDIRWEVAGSLSRPIFFEWLSIVADYRFTRNDSNIKEAATGVEPFDYDRHQATLSLAVKL